MRSAKNDFETMCDELSKIENPILNVRVKVREYVGNDRDKFLLLKAEADSITYYEHVNTMMSIGAFIISVLGIFFDDIISNLWEMIELSEHAGWAVCVYGACILIMIALIAVVGIVPMMKSLKYKSVGKYGKYIRIVLQEMEQDKNLISSNGKSNV